MIGQEIKNRRIELGWTQEQLAEKIGYKHCSSINKIELGINDIPQSKIEKFADVLGVSVLYLLGYHEDSEDEKAVIRAFRSLNIEGQEKLRDYAELLVSSGEYKKHGSVEVVEGA